MTILAIAIASTLAAGQANALPPNQLGTVNSGTALLLENLAPRTISSFTNTNTGNVTTLNNSGSIGDGFSARGIENGGIIGTLNNSGTISGTSVGVFNFSSIGNLTNTGSITAIFNSARAVENNLSIGTLTNTGTIRATGGNSATGIVSSGSIGTLSNTGTIDATSSQLGNGINNAGTIDLLDNDVDGSARGVISGQTTGILNQASGTITTLNNSGDILGTGGSALANFGSIGTLTNTASGMISGASSGIINNRNGSIGTLNNSGTITVGNAGIENFGYISTLTNTASGTINGFFGVKNDNGGRIDTLTNRGTINGGFGVYNSTDLPVVLTRGINPSTPASIGTLNNSGTIDVSTIGVYNLNSSIDTLTNSGTIRGGDSGIWTNGTIGAINNSGLITSNFYALYNNGTGTLGTITNSGTIAGIVVNDSANDLVINGGSDNFGLLTGSSGGSGPSDAGLIENLNSNVVFGTGFQMLNDNINVGTHSVTNTSTGTLLVNSSVNITGNYNQGANASLMFGVNSNAITTGDGNTDGGYGHLVVSGSANIDSGSTVGLTKLGSYGFAQGQRYLVVQANTSGTNYNAGSLHYTAAGYNVAGSSVVDGGNTNLLLTVGSEIPVTPPVTPPITPPDTPPVTPPITPPNVGPINQATTAGGTAALAGLFNYKGFNAGVMNLFNAAADLDSPASGNRAGAQLSPTATLSAATQASTASTVQVLNVTADHLEGLRTAANGSNGTGIATGESAGNAGLWGQGFGGSSRLGERDDVAGYHAHYSGLLLGADAALNDSWRAGGVFSYTRTTVNNDGDNAGSSADVKSYGLFGYASYIGNPWYVDLSLGAVQHKYDTTREVDFPNFSSTAKGQHDGMQYIASVLAGYPIDLGPMLAKTVLTPIAGLTYSTLRQDSYTEKNGDGAALHVNADDIGSLKSDLGAKLEHTFGTSYGSVIPSAQLSWRHEYRDNALQSVANYAADTSGATSFTTDGAKAIRDTGVMAVGLTLVRSHNLSVGAKYTLEAASGYNASTGDVQVRWDF